MIHKRLLVIFIFFLLLFTFSFDVVEYFDHIKTTYNNYRLSPCNNTIIEYKNSKINTQLTQPQEQAITSSLVSTSPAITKSIQKSPEKAKINDKKDNTSNLDSESEYYGESFNSFKYEMETFPWDEYREAVKSNDSDLTDRYSQMLITELTTYIIMPPPVPVNQKCKPDSLPEITDSLCSKYNNNSLFSGKRSQPAKIAHMVQLGFDIDVLEVHLNELYEVVDHFFITESVTTHYHKLKKPLIWDHVKHQDRFSKFQDKVVHFILDDSDLEKEENHTIFSHEKEMGLRRWQKFLDWNKVKNEYSDNDIIGFGDTDEVSARINVHLLKNCQLKEGVNIIDIGIWFPYGPIDQAFKTYYKVPGNPYTLGDPTYYTISAAKTTNATYPTRKRGQSGNFMLGGMHMTHYGYLPFQILKRLSCSECGIRSEEKLNEFALLLQQGKIQELELELLETKKDHRKYLKPLKKMSKKFKKEIAILPWFLKCNLNRYPTWERKNDKRII